MAEMNEANQAYGSIEAHNLDDISTGSGKIGANIIPHINEIEKTTRSTVSLFLFVSPQFLTSNPDIVVLVEAHTRRVLCGIGIDVAHLYVAHSQFRTPIRKLRDLIWEPLFPPDGPSVHPNFWLNINNQLLVGL